MSASRNASPSPIRATFRRLASSPPSSGSVAPASSHEAAAPATWWIPASSCRGASDTAPAATAPRGAQTGAGSTRWWSQLDADPGDDQPAAALDEAAQGPRVRLLDDARVGEYERRAGGVEVELARAFAQTCDGVTVAPQQLGEGGEALLGGGVRRGRRPALAGIGQLDRPGSHVQPDEDRDEADHDALLHERARPGEHLRPAGARMLDVGARSRPAAVDDLVEVAGERAEMLRPEQAHELAARERLGLRNGFDPGEPQQPGAEAQPKRPLQLAPALGLVGKAFELARVGPELVTGTRTPLDDNAAEPRPEQDRDERGASHRRARRG